MKNVRLLGVLGLICIFAIIGLSIALACLPNSDNKNPDNPNLQDLTGTIVSNPNTPDNPDKPDTPNNPDTPDNPDASEAPDNPDTPDTPSTPDNQNNPDNSDTTDNTNKADPQAQESKTETGNSILDDPLLVLCNIDNPLPNNYSVDDLTTAQGKYQLKKVAAEAIKKMIKAAAEDGIDLILCSAYRSVDKQQQLFNNKLTYYKNQGMSESAAYAKTATIIAVPGTSEHHTGLSADIVTPSYQTLDEGFAETDAAKWLKAHCSEYGFILRYPIDKREITKIIFEPWHFRYVGEYAKEITESGLCLEEWIEKVKSENR